MNPATIALYVFVTGVVMSVVVMVLTRTVFFAALSLIVCLISVAGIYALLYAEFLAITQLIIYAGGVLVLILFGIMLTNQIDGKTQRTESHQVVPGLVVSIILFTTLIAAFDKTSFTQSDIVPAPGNHINTIGIELMSTYSVPFEIGGILLLVCLIGASLMASSFKKIDHA